MGAREPAVHLAGHTLGTPDHTAVDALRLFADVGLSYAEVIYQDGYRSALPEADPRAAALLREQAERIGVRVVALTPYMTALNSLDDSERRREVERFRTCIDSAVLVGADRVRVFAGSWRAGQADEERHRHMLVDSLKELGDDAAARGVTLCIENHFNTMATSAQATRRLCREVDSPAVGALYDQANLTFTHDEPFDAAIPLQAPWIRHVHVKDLVFSEPDREFRASANDRVSPEERAVRSRVVGEGILDWEAIIDRLHDIGYTGALSFEYEYRWHREDLPDPAEGFARSVEVLTPLLDRLDAQAARGMRGQAAPHAGAPFEPEIG
jgi:sugar phosphate isomerase/epimerase